MRARFPAPPPQQPLARSPRSLTTSQPDRMDTTPVGDVTADQDAGFDRNGPLPAHQYYALTHVLQQISRGQASLDGTTRTHLQKAIDQLGAPLPTSSTAAERGEGSAF